MAVPLERLEPIRRTVELGALRLTLDEIAGIIEIVQDIPNTDVRLESDGNTFTDARDDLPELGPRIGYVKIGVKHAGDRRYSGDILTINIGPQHSYISTKDPDAAILGHIEFIKARVESYRRIPLWAFKIFRRPNAFGEASLNGWMFFLCYVIFTVGGLSVVVSLVNSNGTGNNAPPFPWPSSLIIAIFLLILVALIAAGFVLSGTIIYTATRRASPTFWQRHRFDIAIHVVVGAIFFLLGLLVGHG